MAWFVNRKATNSDKQRQTAANSDRRWTSTEKEKALKGLADQHGFP